MLAHKITAALPYVNALAAIAVLLAPWVRFSNEPHYSTGLGTVIYVFNEGWLPMISLGAPWGWLALAVALGIIAAAIWIVVDALILRRFKHYPATTALVLTLGYLVFAAPFYEAVHPGIIAPLVVYGWEPTYALYPAVSRRLRAARQTLRRTP